MAQQITDNITHHRASATSSSASSATTPAHTISPTTWMGAQPTASTCASAPVTRSAEEEAFITLPVRCSTHCLSQGVDILQPLVSNNDCSLECGQIRSVGTLFGGISGHVYQHYCLNQIQFSGMCVGSNASWQKLVQSLSMLFGGLVLGIYWRSITKMSTSSIWEVQLFHPVTLAAHIVALARVWVLNMKECCKNYMISSGMLIILWSSPTRTRLHLIRTDSSVSVLSTMVGVMVIWFATINTLQLFLWDPGGDLYFLDGCKSLDCVINLEEQQVVLFLVQRSGEPYRQLLTHVLYPFSPVRYIANVGFASSMSRRGSDTILLAQLMNLYGILHVSSLFAWSANHLLGVAVIKSAEVFRDVGNIIFKLHFYSPVIEDP